MILKWAEVTAEKNGSRVDHWAEMTCDPFSIRLLAFGPSRCWAKNAPPGPEGKLLGKAMLGWTEQRVLAMMQLVK